ncbi:cyclin-dependent kinase inhibitor 1B-like [Clinocottus analis]|uniref:cyclin-dependent kinase inhibitor 1B-like n=1 Tax=Clinocottus analis TaxID=304258 RepID=UPI0035C0865A
MIRAEYARTIPVTLHFKGILLGNRSLKRGLLVVCVSHSPPPTHPPLSYMCNKMSEVRLSNASPTVERVEARQPDAATPSVRRNLFGRPDPGEIRSYADTLIREDVRSFTETYNFDPVAERPLSPRNYDWQEDRDAPEFYVRPPHGRRRPRRDVDTDRQDAGERSGGQAAAQPNRDAPRKRGSGASGSCSSESQSKRSRANEEDDDDEDHGAGSQAVKAAEESPSRPEQGAEVQ